MTKFIKAKIGRLLPHLFASEGELEGDWKSSVDLTIKHNDFTTLPKNKADFLEQIMGELQISYSADSLKERSSDKTIKIAGKEHKWHGATHGKTLQYKMFKQSPKVIYVIQENPYGKSWFLKKSEFVSENVYKVRSDSIEEYFVRQDIPKESR